MPSSMNAISDLLAFAAGQSSPRRLYPLMELPTGAWVDPFTIDSIRPFPAAEPYLGYLGSRPRVYLGSGEASCMYEVTFETFSEAQQWAYDFGKRLNEARAAALAIEKST